MVSVQNICLDRRGISPVVATVALVLITVAAAMFIAGFVVPFVRNQLNEGTECLGYEDYFTFYEEFDYNCYRIDNNPQGTKNYIYALSISADTVPEEKVEGIKALRIQFLGGGEDRGIEVSNGTAAGSNVGQIRMIDKTASRLALPERGGVKTYIYNSSIEFEIIELYPVLKNGRMCKQTDKIRIRDIYCEPNVDLEV